MTNPLQKAEGLIAATYTPMAEDGSVNLAVIDQQCRHLVEEGAVAGVFVCGTTGEGLSLTVSERMAVTEKWIGAAAGRLRVFVHAGHNAVKESVNLAAHAQEAGADAVAALAPSFFKPATAGAVADFCREVAGACPELPFYYYHIPSMTGVAIPIHDILEKVDRNVPNFRGVKFTYEDLMDYNRSVVYGGGKFDILFGRDEILLAGLALGATGAVGSTYGFFAPLYAELIARFRNGDIEKARELQNLSQEMIAVFVRHGGLPAGKAIMKMIGIDCGPVRAPLQTVTGERYQKLEAELKGLGIFEYSARPGIAAG